jgi:predicted RNA-binding protein with PUA-like domain
VVGTAIIAREAYPDPTAFDRKDRHYDPKSDPARPTWFTVDVRLERIFPEPLPLDVLRSVPALKAMELLRKGSRLSVQSVRKAEFEAILKLAVAP